MLSLTALPHRATLEHQPPTPLPKSTTQQGVAALMNFTQAAGNATEVIECPQHIVGQLIGRGGEIVREMQSRSRCVFLFLGGDCVFFLGLGVGGWVDGWVDWGCGCRLVGLGLWMDCVFVVRYLPSLPSFLFLSCNQSIIHSFIHPFIHSIIPQSHLLQGAHPNQPEPPGGGAAPGMSASH